MGSSIGDEIVDKIIEKQIEDLNFRFDNLKDIKRESQKWLIKEDKIKNELENQAKTILRRYTIGSRTANKKTWQNVFTEYYADNRAYSNYEKTKEQYLKHYKDGYRLIHYIREFFTGQEIIYKLLIKGEGDEKEDLYEVKLSLEKILDYTTVTNTGAKKQILKTSIEDVIPDLEVKYSEITNIVKNLEKLGISPNEEDFSIKKIEKIKLWNSLFSLYYAGRKFNRGRVYELYRIFRGNETGENKSRYAKINYIGERQKKLADTIRWNLPTKAQNSTEEEGKLENIGGWKKGDYGLEQLKSLITGNAKLMSSNTMKKVLIDTVRALNKPTKQELTKALIEIYTVQGNQKEKMKENIDKKVNKEAEENIKKIVNEYWQ